MGRVILVEGLDLAGKSTLVGGLAARLRSRGLEVRRNRNAWCEANPIAPVAEAVARDPERGPLEAGALFLSAHLWDARTFRRPPRGTVHLQDSCWLRTLAFERLRPRSGVLDLLLESAEEFPRPDATVVLTAGLEERLRRLGRRRAEEPGRACDTDLWVVQDPERFQRLERLLVEVAREFTHARVIDTTSLTPAEALDQAWTSIAGVLRDPAKAPPCEPWCSASLPPGSRSKAG